MSHLSVVILQLRLCLISWCCLAGGCVAGASGKAFVVSQTYRSGHAGEHQIQVCVYV